MNGKLKAVVIALLIVVAGYAVWSNTQESTDKSADNVNDVVKIGVIAPLSGDAAVIGQEIQTVLSYRINEINQTEGTKFELVYEDSKCSGGDAVNAFQKLKDIDRVKFIIGGICSSETLGVAPLTTDGQVLVVSPGSSNPDVGDASPYVFSLSYSDNAIGTTLAEQMKGYSKVAIISEQNDYNIGVKNVWEAQMANHSNVEIVANEVFTKGNTDFRSLLTKVKAANPEAIFLNPNAGVTAENLLKQLAENSDWTGYTLYSQIAYLGDESRVQASQVAEGMIIVDSPNLTDEKFLAHKSAIVASSGNELASIGSYYVASTIDTANILTSLIREIGPDQMAVTKALNQRSFAGYVGTIDFANGGFSAHALQSGVYKVENGSPVYQK